MISDSNFSKKSNYHFQTIKRPKVELEVKLAEAEVRRKELEEEKVNNVMERSGLERHGKMRSASAYKREQQYSATVAKRQQQLQVKASLIKKLVWIIVKIRQEVVKI